MSARFNVPPVWQSHLPPNFHPQTDWTPDPAWGLPAAGWPLWVDSSTGYPAQPPTEYSNNPYLNVSVVPGAESSASFSGPIAPTAPAKKPLSKNAKIGLGVGSAVVVLAMLGACGGGGGNDAAPQPVSTEVATPSSSEQASAEPVVEAPETATPSPTAEATEEPEPTEANNPKIKMPATQQSFSDQVAKSSAKYDETENELKMSKTILDRDKALCKTTGGEFSGWKATVHDVGSTGDGYGYIAMIMDDDIELSTWNNALSDAFDNTLIKPSNKLYDVLMELSAGDEVTISGKFIKGENTCVTTSNLTEVLNASSPDFKVNFTSIKTN